MGEEKQRGRKALARERKRERKAERARIQCRLAEALAALAQRLADLERAAAARDSELDALRSELARARPQLTPGAHPPLPTPPAAAAPPPPPPSGPPTAPPLAATPRPEAGHPPRGGCAPSAPRSDAGVAAEGLGAPAAPGDALSPLVVLMLGLVLLVVLAFVAKLGFDLRSLSRSLEGGCGGRGEVAQPAREPIVPGPEPGREGDTTRAEGFEPLLRDAFAALLADAARAPTLAPLRELLLGLERSDASGRPGALVRVELGPGSALHLADGSLLRGSQEWPAVELWVEHGPLGSPIVVRPAGAGLPPVALRSIERPAELRFRLAARE